ncbi:acetolactate decarboxylase [Staphylococcus felis]|uniref:acetolactate decarboxylase n=1 Tax=Staphylococcus felis TaxID=46127 RepID=UPI00247FCFE8|nr:acetolactate decarboxylase [Staphylococcus felis]MDQ7193026.1 acetolactate decarboxylase [Staphylococcus felis]
MSKHTLYQHGTLGTLMAGALEGTASIDELLQKGDHGIATLTGSNGEVILVEGKAYHASADNDTVVELRGGEKTPYATVAQFVPDTLFHTKVESHESLYKKICSKMLSENVFAVVKITGMFKHMHIRVMPKQEPPYQRLIESARKQPQYRRDNVEGTIVAIFTPEIFHGVGSAGFHAHFLSDDTTFMGHILDFEIEHGKIEIQNCNTFEQHLPTDPSFLNKTFDYQNITKDITEAE